jgi:hypothetical protein
VLVRGSRVHFLQLQAGSGEPHGLVQLLSPSVVYNL